MLLRDYVYVSSTNFELKILDPECITKANKSRLEELFVTEYTEIRQCSGNPKRQLQENTVGYDHVLGPTDV